MAIRFRFVSACAFLLLVFLCLPPCLCMHSAAEDDRDPYRGQVKFLDETPYVTKAVLRNGMTVLVNEHQSHPVVSLQMYVRAGMLDEPPGSPGMARLLAAAVGRSGTDGAEGTLHANLRLMGAFPSNFTDYAHTCFEINVPSPQWRKALELQSRALADASFDPETVEVESRLLREEAEARLEDAALFARESLRELGLGSIKAAQWSSVLGGAPGPASPEELKGFYRRMYGPERMMLAVSGDVRAGEVLDEAVRLYGDWKPSGGAQPAGSIESSQNGFRYRKIQGNTAAPLLLFGFHAPRAGSSDYPAMEVLSALLGLGEGSVLPARLRDGKGVILNGSADLSAGPGFGYLTIEVTAETEDIDRSEIAVLTELELIKRKAPAAVDMERAWAQLERAYRSRIETVSGRARALAQFDSLGDWKRLDRYISELRNVRAEEVRRVAARYLNLNRCSLIEYLPVALDGDSRTVDSIRNTFEALLGPSADQEEALREKETVLAVEVPESGSDFKFSPIQYPYKIASVLRGPEIYIREDHTAPLIHMGLFFPGGRLAETGNNAGITGLLVRMLLQGSEKRSAARFHRQMEVYGGQVQPVVADDFFGFYFSIISKNFGEGFRLLTESIKTPVLSRENLERQKQLLEAERGRFQGWGKMVGDSVNPELFKGFSYSTSATGSEESVRSITLDAVNEWYDRFVRNRKPLVVIVGDTEGTSLASYFVRDFSGSRFQETELPGDFAAPLERKETIERTRDGSASLVSIAFQAPPLADIDRHTAEVLESYFGNAGRMARAIRDRLGATRKIGVSYTPRLRGGSFLAYAVTGQERETDILDAMENEFRLIVDNPIPYRDFRSAVNSAAGAFLIRQQSPLAQIVEVSRNALAGEEIGAYRSHPTKLESVFEEDLKDAAERIFRMEKAVFLRIYGSRPLSPKRPESE
ncbi:MAG: insulinase family protein [Acidobacteria bacterium]|nr:insulinase family protein [Acidobacteriota bacterium]